MDVNIRLTIEPAAFFNVSLADRTATKLQVVRAKGSNRNSLPLPLPLLLSLFFPLLFLLYLFLCLFVCFVNGVREKNDQGSRMFPPRESLEPLPTGNCL